MKLTTPVVSPEVDALYKKHIALPSGVPKNKAPVALLEHSFLWNKVLPLIGFPCVKVVDVTKDKNNPVYRVEFRVFGVCTHYVHLTPFGVYTVGLVLSFVSRTLPFDPLCLVPHPDVGMVVVPRWAIKPLMRKLADVCAQHHNYLELVVGAIHELSAKAEKDAEPVVTTGDLLATNKEPTIH